MADSVNMEPVDNVDDHGTMNMQHPHQDSSQTESSCGKKRKAIIWDHFVVYKDEKGKEKARCKACEKSYAIGSSTHGTSNLIKHYNSCNKHDNQDVRQMHLNQELNLRSRNMVQELYREKMARAIMKHNYPFLIVEHDGLQDVHAYLNPDVKTYTRNTAKADCLKYHARERDKLKLAMERAPGRICLTSDCWSSCVGEGYICLTAHFVDENWVLRSKIINFSHLPTPHTGVAMCEEIFKFLKEWGIEKKVMTLTLDNASNCDNMQEFLKNRLKNLLPCGGDYFNVRCSAHVLNLIVQDGLKVASETLRKIRNSVLYVKGSKGRRLKFVAACEQIGVDYREGFRIDCPTRWSSTQLMLERILKYREAFIHYALVEAGYCYALTTEEWERAEILCKFLKPFAEITTLMSGSDYPTANLYFQNVWKIQLCLLEESLSRDDLICDMAVKMLEKFKKYWENYLVILALAIILDPRYKLKFVEFCYRKIDQSSCEKNVRAVHLALSILFQEYVNASKSTTQPPNSENNASPTIVEDDISEFDYYEEHDSNKSELELYLEEPKLDRKQYPHLDILVYWKDNRARYPILAVMARDIMAIPITTVASESAFSIGAKVLTKYRSSMLPDNAEALICTHNWLLGYEAQSEEPTDEELEISLSSSIVTQSRESAGSSI